MIPHNLKIGSLYKMNEVDYEEYGHNMFYSPTLATSIELHQWLAYGLSMTKEYRDIYMSRRIVPAPSLLFLGWYLVSQDGIGQIERPRYAQRWLCKGEQWVSFDLHSSCLVVLAS